MKKKILFVLLSLLSLNLFAQIKSVEEFRERRVLFYCSDSDNSVVEEITQELKLLQDNKKNYTEENYITIENNLVLEKINFLGNASEAKKESYLLLNNQSLKSNLLMEGKKLKTFSSDFLVSVGDIKTRLLEFLSPAQVISESMAAKDLFLAALKNDKKSSPAHLSYALWLYFAPPIVGGGLLESYKGFMEAEKYARNNSEKYFALIYKSQILVAMERYEDASKTLQQAHDLFPDEKFIKVIKETNEKGSIFFD